MLFSCFALVAILAAAPSIRHHKEFPASPFGSSFVARDSFEAGMTPGHPWLHLRIEFSPQRAELFQEDVSTLYWWLAMDSLGNISGNLDDDVARAYRNERQQRQPFGRYSPRTGELEWQGQIFDLDRPAAQPIPSFPAEPFNHRFFGIVLGEDPNSHSVLFYEHELSWDEGGVSPHEGVSMDKLGNLQGQKGSTGHYDRTTGVLIWRGRPYRIDLETLRGLK